MTVGTLADRLIISHYVLIVDEVFIRSERRRLWQGLYGRIVQLLVITALSGRVFFLLHRVEVIHDENVPRGCHILSFLLNHIPLLVNCQPLFVN